MTTKSDFTPHEWDLVLEGPPSAGMIRWMRAPSGPGVRWESGVESGCEVTLFYDSMLAKLIVHAADRSRAIETMRRALRELTVVGVATNVPFHLQLLADPDFARGAIDIQFLERRPDLMAPPVDEATLFRIAIAAALLAEERRMSRRSIAATAAPGRGPAVEADGWTRAARRDALR